MKVAVTADNWLETGDRMSVAEFHRRYSARPDIHKAELIRGVVYTDSGRVPATTHGTPHSLMAAWLTMYSVREPSLHTASRSTVFIAEDSEVQPDVCVYWDPAHGRGAQLDADGFLVGAPELIVEIAMSSASYDLHDKKLVYEQAGVIEYIVWRGLDHEMDWFRLVASAYRRVAPDADGVIESVVFPRLRLPVPAALAGDAIGVFAAVGFTDG